MTKHNKVLEWIKTWRKQNPFEKFAPSENNLIIKLGFSRNTIRSAIKVLVDMKVIIPIKGKGYAYSNLKSVNLKSYHFQYDKNHSTIFIKNIKMKKIHKELDVNNYWKLIKVRYKNQKPFILTIQYVPTYIFSLFKNEDYKKSLYKALEDIGEKIIYARKKVEYVSTPKKCKIFLPAISNETVLLTSKTYNSNNRIIEYSENYYYPKEFLWEFIEKTY